MNDNNEKEATTYKEKFEEEHIDVLKVFKK